MKTEYPYIARQTFNAHGNRYCCPNRKKRLKLTAMGEVYTPRIGGPICCKCEYHAKIIYTAGTEYVCCKWMSKREKKKL